MSGVWVFGYGSLVSADSFAYTIGRAFTPGVDFLSAEVRGYGRRWNYGAAEARESAEPDGTVRRWTAIVLGLVESDDETVNGVVGWVDAHELVAVDRRERHYDRVDVSDLVSVDLGEPVVTYVPRVDPIRRYERARDGGTAAIDRRYWDLVDGAFVDLGDGERERFRATTPSPDVPIVTMRSDRVPDRYQVSRPGR